MAKSKDPLCLSAVWGIIVWFIQVIEKMGDAYGLTVSIEITRMVQKFVGLALIVILFIWGQLHLGSLFLYYYFILGFMIAGSIWVMGHKGYSLRRGWKISRGQVKFYIKELYHYSHPLFVFALVGLLANLFDRWLLQVFSGSTQQGFYGLSYQIGAICFVFTGAMTPLLTREFAISFEKGDLPEMARLFRKFVPVFYALTAFLTCYLAVQADKVVLILGGKSFSEAYVAVLIMAFYPVYQTYGQLSGSVFFATGQTTIYRNIGIIFLLAGLPLTYFLIAPRNHFGLDAGATGLAIKMVLISVIGVNVQLYFNSRLLGLRFWRYVGHQVFSLICLLALAFLIVRGMDITFPFQNNVLLSFCLSGVIYTLVVLGLVYLKPVIFGLKRQDLNYIKEKLLGGIFSS
jgi:O-antigen/teichoic acid export membrane protein